MLYCRVFENKKEFAVVVLTSYGCHCIVDARTMTLHMTLKERHNCKLMHLQTKPENIRHSKHTSSKLPKILWIDYEHFAQLVRY